MSLSGNTNSSFFFSPQEFMFRIDLHSILIVVWFQLEEVMETETYKNAKAILERFDPDAKKKPVSSLFWF